MRQHPLETEVYQAIEQHSQPGIIVDALYAALGTHSPSTLTATERFGEYTCAFCWNTELTLQRTYSNKDGSVMHEHYDPKPWCHTCDGLGYDTTSTWPCSTWTSVYKALQGRDYV